MWQHNKFTVNKYTVVLAWLRFGGKSTVVADTDTGTTLTTKYPILNKKSWSSTLYLFLPLTAPLLDLADQQVWCLIDPLALSHFSWSHLFFSFFQSPCFTHLFSHIPPLSYALDSTSPIYDILYMNVKEGGGKIEIWLMGAHPLTRLRHLNG